MAFSASAAQFGRLRDFLTGEAAAGLSHFELEEYIRTDGFELLRLLLQDHFDLRASREERLAGVQSVDGVAHRAVERGHERCLATVVGTVRINRIAYRHRGEENLYPADASLNLPDELHSYGLRELVAIESARGSFEEAKEAVIRSTGVKIGHRQVEALARASAVDFEAFYDRRRPPQQVDGEVVVISADGKGVAMRSEDLRPATARAQAAAEAKLRHRRSKGEKPCKRMAEVAAVYSVEPVPRSPGEVMASHDEGTKQAPKAKNKWLTASVVEDAAEVIAEAFREAERRDPEHTHDWVALVDGANHQIDRIKAEAKQRHLDITIVVDLIHVLGYLWDAVWCFFPEGDPAAETWVANKAQAVLEGKAGLVAAAIKRKATNLGLGPNDRKNADTCAGYLHAKARYLDYPKALAAGWPVATGIIEGACRYLVKDRLGLSGARWRLEGAEAVLKLRAIRKNDDWDDYFSFHMSQQRKRVHDSRYAGEVIPLAA
ncbi:MAG: ISKra4 family transposase [Acidimicrobiales bacterium]